MFCIFSYGSRSRFEKLFGLVLFDYIRFSSVKLVLRRYLS